MGNGILKSDEEWQKEKSPICLLLIDNKKDDNA